LNDPALAALADEVPADWRELGGPGAQLLAEIVDIARAYPAISSAALVERWRGTEQESIVRRLEAARIADAIDDRVKEFRDTLTTLNLRVAKDRRDAAKAERLRQIQERGTGDS
jgi:DNA primase